MLAKHKHAKLCYNRGIINRVSLTSVTSSSSKAQTTANVVQPWERDVYDTR
jgi:hypothetical protein